MLIRAISFCVLKNLGCSLELQVYGEIDKQIAAARQQEESAIATSNNEVRQLLKIRQDFELILSDISKATENPVI